MPSGENNAQFVDFKAQPIFFALRILAEEAVGEQGPNQAVHCALGQVHHAADFRDAHYRAAVGEQQEDFQSTLNRLDCHF